MNAVPDAALTTIRAALEDAERRHEAPADAARRVIADLHREGYAITPDTDQTAA